MVVVYWLILFIVLLVIEALTVNLVTIWFAIGAVAAAVTAYFGGNIMVQLVVFLIVSIVLLILTKPIVKKHFNNNRTKTNADRLVGKEGIVTEPINGVEATGRVTVAGQDWAARPTNPGAIIPDGYVTVMDVQGCTLIVEAQKQG